MNVVERVERNEIEKDSNLWFQTESVSKQSYRRTTYQY